MSDETQQVQPGDGAERWEGPEGHEVKTTATDQLMAEHPGEADELSAAAKTHDFTAPHNDRFLDLTVPEGSAGTMLDEPGSLMPVLVGMQNKFVAFADAWDGEMPVVAAVEDTQEAAEAVGKEFLRNRLETYFNKRMPQKPTATTRLVVLHITAVPVHTWDVKATVTVSEADADKAPTPSPII